MTHLQLSFFLALKPAMGSTDRLKPLLQIQGTVSSCFNTNGVAQLQQKRACSEITCNFLLAGTTIQTYLDYSFRLGKLANKGRAVSGILESRDISFV